MSTALYRRYRPDNFADVIGQEHVTEPLMAALKKNRVNHAYLFSGPRGCGKTTSARILARCLNCAEGPTPVPCGKCDSCLELGNGGPGSLDVIEIDAASHGGVDDARDLRERATFAPVRDRYKIFIIDEAHMVTSAGFNALLKIVEEPPEHIKFIFATTEPDKVIGTIRSRTHHYPFRLVPPEPLIAYLELLCSREEVAVAPGVLSLVVRAGGGSVRDSLSVLDQLIAGAGAQGLDYELAVSLLGYTHATLLDDVVDAIAAADAATVFKAVDRVIQTGHDPRRFVEDLLERFRDLIIVKAMPESAQSILRGMPEDQVARMRTQAQQLGSAELSRSADVTNTALTEMTGATSPRLHLELLCARILLPGSDHSERGVGARVDRIERRLEYGGSPVDQPVEMAAVAAPAAAPVAAPVAAPMAGRAAAPVAAAAEVPTARPAPAAEAAPAAPVQERPVAADWGGTWATPVDAAPAAAPAAKPAADAPKAGPAPEPAERSRPVVEEPRTERPAQVPSQPPAAAAAPQAAPAAAPATPAAGGGNVEMIRRAWPEIMDALKTAKKFTWMIVQPHASAAAFDGATLTVAFSNPGAMGSFGAKTENIALLQASINKVLGLNCQIVVTTGGAAPAGEPDPKVPSRPAPAAEASTPAPAVPGPAAAPAADDDGWGPVAPIPGNPENPARAAGSDSPAGPANQAGPALSTRPATDRETSALPASPRTAPAQPTAPQPTTSQAASGQLASPRTAAPEAATVPRSAPARPAEPVPAGAPAVAGSIASTGPTAPAMSPASAAAGPGIRPAAAGRPAEASPARPAQSAPAPRRVSAPVDPDFAGPEPEDDGAARDWDAHDVPVSEWDVPGAGAPAAGATRQPPVRPASAAPPARSDQQLDPAPPSMPAGSVQPAQPSPSVQPLQPAPAAQSVQTAQPVQPAQPARQALPAQTPPAQAQQSQQAPAAGTATARPANGAPLSRYQQLLSQAAAAAPSSAGGAYGQRQAPGSAAGGGNLKTGYVEDIPSEDDITLEDSGLVGRPAIERLLNGRLIEERSPDGSPLI